MGLWLLYRPENWRELTLLKVSYHPGVVGLIVDLERCSGSNLGTVNTAACFCRCPGRMPDGVALALVVHILRYEVQEGSSG